MIDAQVRRVSLFDMELGEVMVVQDCEELLATEFKHILVTFELEHAAPQCLRVYPSQMRSPPIESRVPTFHCKDAQMVNAHFVDEVIRVRELVRDSDLTEIEGGSTRIIAQLTSLRAFMSSSKHRVKALSGGGTDVETAPGGVGRGEENWISSMGSSSPEESTYRGS